LVSLLGIKHVVVAVNKMDLMDYSESVYNEIQQDYLKFAEQLNIPDIQFVPISALEGDNVVNKSGKTPWYTGNALMQILETIEIGKDANHEDFRFPVQYVNRPHLNFRGFAGTVVSGEIAPGDEVTTLPSGKKSTVASIETFEGQLDRAYTPQAVTLTLADEIDISRGDMIVKSDNLPLHASRLKSHLVWMSDEPLMPNKQYSFKFATKTVSGSVSSINYQIDVNTTEHSQAVHLNLNEIAVVDLKLTQPVACDPYTRNRKTGAFIVIDRLTNGTVGAGMIIDEAQSGDQQGEHGYSEFELEFNALVRKHFPHWNAIDISQN
jgi:sulfate adenylyltransferase subunit 1